MLSPNATGLILAAVLATAFPQTGRATDTPYEINVIASLTGQGAFIGKTNQAVFTALEATVNKHGGINGQPVHFVFYDDQTSPQVAVQVENDIVKKKVPFFLGPAITGTCRATAALVANGPVEYCLSPGLHPPKGSYAFSVSVSTEDSIGIILRYMRERGLHRIARLTTTDASGQDGDDAFAHWLAQPENKDFTVVAAEHFAPADVSVAAQMAKIVAAQPQALVVWASGTPLATALRAFHDGGVDVPVFVSNANMSSVQLKQYAGFLPKDLYSMATGYAAMVAKSSGSRKALALYRESIDQSGIANDYISGIVWDAAMITIDAIRRYGVNATADQVRDYIEHLSGYPGIAGTYDFTDGSQRGLGQSDLLVMRYEPATATWRSVSKFGGDPLR